MARKHRKEDVQDIHSQYSQLLLERGHCWQDAEGYLGQAWWLRGHWPEDRFHPGLSKKVINQYYESGRCIGVILQNCSRTYLAPNSPVWTGQPPYRVTGYVQTDKYDDVWPDALYFTDPMLTIKVPPRFYFWGLAQPEAFAT